MGEGREVEAEIKKPIGWGALCVCLHPPPVGRGQQLRDPRAGRAKGRGAHEWGVKEDRSISLDKSASRTARVRGSRTVPTICRAAMRPH